MTTAADRPHDPPAAPWCCEARAVIWASRAGRGVSLGGLIAYRVTPVGPYQEIFAAPIVLRAGGPVARVVLMAVDSAASRAGGRHNWALPKVLACFDRVPGGATVRGEGWEVTVTARARRRWIPVRARGRCVQPWPDGRVRDFAMRIRGRASLATVEVCHYAPLLTRWLPAGQHLAVAFDGTVDLMPPRDGKRRGWAAMPADADARPSWLPASAWTS
jgi:hypothetical protein